MLCEIQRFNLPTINLIVCVCVYKICAHACVCTHYYVYYCACNHIDSLLYSTVSQISNKEKSYQINDSD